MTYKDLEKTFNILSKYEGDKEVIWDWAEHDEYGYGIEVNLSIEDIKALRDIGWMLGSDSELSNEDAEKWDNQDTSDEELLELWDYYKGIFKFA